MMQNTSHGRILIARDTSLLSKEKQKKFSSFSFFHIKNDEKGKKNYEK